MQEQPNINLCANKVNPVCIGYLERGDTLSQFDVIYLNVAGRDHEYIWFDYSDSTAYRIYGNGTGQAESALFLVDTIGEDIFFSPIKESVPSYVEAGLEDWLNHKFRNKLLSADNFKNIIHFKYHGHRYNYSKYSHLNIDSCINNTTIFLKERVLGSTGKQKYIT